MSSLMEIISFTCIVLLMNLVANNADDRIGPKENRGHTALRRLDCALFCKKTGFSGIVGGCQCGFTLFSSKRSEGTPNENVGYSTANKINGLNTYSRNVGSNPMRYGFNRYSNDDHLRTHFLIPFTTRPFGHI